MSTRRRSTLRPSTYETPLLLNVPSFAICCATILDMGSEDQKRAHIRAALQRRGSARPAAVGAQRRVGPRGCHHPGRSPGWTVDSQRRQDVEHLGIRRRLRPVPGTHRLGRNQARRADDVPGTAASSRDHDQSHHADKRLDRILREFFDDVELGDDAVVGEPGKGWEVASRQLYHERRTMGDGSEYTSGPGIADAEDVSIDLLALVDKTNQHDSERVREMVGRALVHRAVHAQLSEHVFHAVAGGSLPPAGGSIIRLSMAETHDVDTDTATAVAGSAAVVEDSAGLLEIGTRYLGRQIASIGGGTTEMARNVIGERVLNFPREHAADRGVPFNQVRRNRAPEGDRNS